MYLFLERAEGREKKKNVDRMPLASVASCMPPTGGLACNSVTCPDGESNW